MRCGEREPEHATGSVDGFTLIRWRGRIEAR
jgi:hypothetical protein